MVAFVLLIAAAAWAVNGLFIPTGIIAGKARQATSARHSAASSLFAVFISLPPPLTFFTIAIITRITWNVNGENVFALLPVLLTGLRPPW